MDELFTFMLFSNEFELIDLGLFDPAYLEIQDFNKDWKIYSQKVKPQNLRYNR